MIKQIEAMKLALEALEQWNTPLYKRGIAITALRETLAEQPRGEATLAQQEHEYRCCPHDSDCAVHNEPAYPAGSCDCTYRNTHNLPKSAVVHEVCLALTSQALDKLEHENFGRMPNDSWTNKVLDVYHFFDSNPKAKKLTVIYTTPQVREWVGLTDEEIDKTYETKVWDARRSYARAIEAKLKEKNT
jgi:hypothetical protein